MSLADRRAAALSALARKTPPARQRYPGETQPSGDMPDDPWQAEAYFAERWYLDWPEEPQPCGCATQGRASRFPAPHSRSDGLGAAPGLPVPPGRSQALYGPPEGVRPNPSRPAPA